MLRYVLSEFHFTRSAFWEGEAKKQERHATYWVQNVSFVWPYFCRGFWPGFLEQNTVHCSARAEKHAYNSIVVRFFGFSKQVSKTLVFLGLFESWRVFKRSRRLLGKESSFQKV